MVSRQQCKPASKLARRSGANAAAASRGAPRRAATARLRARPAIPARASAAAAAADIRTQRGRPGRSGLRRRHRRRRLLRRRLALGRRLLRHLLRRLLRRRFHCFLLLARRSGLLRLSRLFLRLLRHDRPPDPCCQWRIPSAPMGDRIAPNHCTTPSETPLSTLPWTGASPHAADAPEVSADVAPP